MRKYKDVGKRILVLVLSVCMIAGVLPAIPAEAADAFPGNGSITLGADANGATATGNDTYTYTGQEVKPAVTVQIDGETLKEKEDYSVYYRNNTSAGTAYIDIVGIGDSHRWQTTKSFTIAQQKLSYIGVNYKGVEGTGEDGYVYYTGSDVLPTITGVYGIISGTSTMVNLSADDYNVEYTSGSNTTVGTHSFKIVLKSSSNYTFSGTITENRYNIYYNIGADSVTVSNGLSDSTYTGTAQRPEFTLVDSQNSAGIQASDYTTSWADNTNAGTAKMTVTANSSSLYRGSKTFNFLIGKADLSAAGISVSLKSDKYYYVKNSKPDMTNEVVVKLNGVEIPAGNYNVAYRNETTAGQTGTNNLIITGTGNLTGNAFINFEIYDKLGKAVLDKNELEYNGKKNVPNITVSNTSGDVISDSRYKITYYKDAEYTKTVSEPTSIGRYYVKVTGLDYYEGDLGTKAEPIYFDIVAKSLDKCTFKLAINGTEAGVINKDTSYSSFFDGKSKVLSLTATDDEGNALKKGTDFDYAVYRDPECTEPADDKEGTTGIQELIHAATYYLKITGLDGSNYAGGERVYTYMIKPKNISPTDIVITDQTYTGSAVVPDPANITVYYKEGSKNVTLDSQYVEVVSCEDNIEIGTNNAKAYIRLTGDYALAEGGVNRGTFSIVPRKLNECECNIVAGSANYDPTQVTFEYNGSMQVPAIRITDNNGAKGLVQGEDFKVTYFTDSAYKKVIAEPVDAGTYYVLISGLGTYANLGGSIRTSYKITPKNMSTLTVTASNCGYTGEAVEPGISVSDGNRVLVAGVDYEVEGYYDDELCKQVSEHKNSGKVYVRIKAVDGKNYTGTATTTFFIGANIATVVPAFNISGGTYNRNSHKDEMIQAIETKMMDAIPDPSSYSISFYSDAAHKNVVSSETNEAFINAGTIYFAVSGKGQYYGDISGYAVIAKKDISELNARVNGTYTYNGIEQKVVISTTADGDGVVLQYPTTNGYILTDKEYSIESSENAINAGIAALTLKAAENSNYTGTTTVSYTINQKDINELSKLRVDITSPVYANKVLTPSVKVSYGDSSKLLSANKDYQFEVYSDEDYQNVATAAEKTNAGTTYVRIQGIGNYCGVLESANYTADKIAGSNQFIIQRKSIDGVGVSLQGMSYIFKKSIPDFTVTQSFPNESGIGEYSYTLQPGVDYTYTPTQVDKFKVGQQDITIEGTGNFKGTKNSYFYYDGDMNNSADQIEVKLSYDTIEYDKAQAASGGMKPTVTVYVKGSDTQERLIEGTHYSVSYRNNTIPGQASVLITGIEKNHWVGSYVANFAITGKIEDAEITIPAQKYTGSEYNTTTQPIENMTVVCDGKTLALGTDYNIKSIVNGKSVSLTDPTVTIEGTGTYFSGEKSAKFAIKYDLGSDDLSIDLGGDVFSYTGQEIRPVPVVKYALTGSTFDTLEEGKDYTVTYRKNTAVAAANGENGPCVVIQATANGKLMGTTKAKAFTIDSIHMEDYEITGIADSYVYTGKLIKPDSLVIKKIGGSEVIDPANYSVYYQTDADNPSSAPAGATETITVIGKGNYKGTLTKTFTITKRDLSTVSKTIDDVTYNGEAQEPEIKLTFNDENNKEQTLTLDTDYVVDEYRNNINAANAGGANAPYAAIHGVASCTGTATVEFNILKKNVEDLVYSKIEDPQYVPLKTKYEPELNVYMTSTSAEPLVRNVDYVAAYFNNEAVKDANGTSGPFVQITPKDTTNYTGSKTIPFSILARDLSSENISAALSDASDTGFDPANRNYPYIQGTTYTPNISLKDNSENGIVALVNGTDFTYEYSTNNSQVGTAWIKVTGQGNYSGTRIEKFTIGTLLSNDTLTVTGISDTVYNGLDTKPKNIQVKFNKTGSYLTENEDYIVKYYIDKDCTTEASAIDLIHAGTVYVGIVGTENDQTGYVGTAVYPYQIARKSLTSADIEITGTDNVDYTGSEIKPVLTLKDTSTGLTIDSSQYEVTYENNTAIGTASATVTATESGNYKDSITVYYKITKHDIGNAVAEAIPDQKYTGNYIRPALTIYDNGKLLVEGKDYQVVNGNNLRAGESWVVIKGLGNYDETKRVYFNIVASLEDAIIDSVPEQLYTGSPICPSIHVACGGNTLTLNEDYETTYANNELAGDASITVRPLTQYYTGTIVKKFKISNSLSKATVTGIPASEQYTGQTYKPVPVVKMGSKVLTEDVDYTVRYSNNSNVGTARVIISGIGVYSGEKVVTFVIKEKSIENCTVLAVASQTYNGRLLTPPVVVKDGTTMLKENVAYKLSYRDNYSVGTAYVTITGIGDYKGSVTKSFAITEPVLTSDVIVQSRNAATGTFDIVVDGVPGYVTSVSVPVWTKADQSDIVWYNASRVDADTFIVHANIANHKNNVGVYNIHVYVSGGGYKMRCAYATTTVFGAGYERVFDLNYYIKNNPDVAKAFGGNTEAIFAHFVNNGEAEGRQAIANFNVASYRARYADLRSAFGNNLKAYYDHYRINGYAEGRVATGSTELQNPTTVYNGVDYKLVYDYNYYINKYPDIKAAFNGDENATLRHFVECGMNEGRQGKASFNVAAYRANYADLRSAFGRNLKAYYMHYIGSGYREGRKATGNGVLKNPVTVYNGVDYSLVYDYNYYISKYSDLKAAFYGDDTAALRHFVECGMNEGRQAKDSFNVKKYKNRYNDLQNAFGNDLKSYYMHYIGSGYKEGRKGN